MEPILTSSSKISDFSEQTLASFRTFGRSSARVGWHGDKQDEHEGVKTGALSQEAGECSSHLRENIVKLIRLMK